MSKGQGEFLAVRLKLLLTAFRENLVHDTHDLRVADDFGRFIQVINLLDLLGAQLDVASLDELVQLFELGRAHDRSRDEWLGDGPRQRGLRHRDAAFLGDLLDFGNDSLGRFGQAIRAAEAFAALRLSCGFEWPRKVCDELRRLSI